MEEEKRRLVRWLRPDYQIPRFAKGVDKQAAKEQGAQGAAELIAAVEQKPSFHRGASPHACRSLYLRPFQCACHPGAPFVAGSCLELFDDVR
jgi:hypothetical protein